MRVIDSDSEDGRGEWSSSRLEDEKVLQFIERSEAWGRQGAT
jgi:hypothetical protein